MSKIFITELERRKRIAITRPIFLFAISFLLLALLSLAAVFISGSGNATTLRSAAITVSGLVFSLIAHNHTQRTGKNTETIFIITIILFGSAYGLFSFGANLSQSLMLLGFVVTFANATLERKDALLVSIISILISPISFAFQLHNGHPLVQDWMTIPASWIDITVYALTVGLFFFTSRKIDIETNKALLQAISFEDALMKERDALEVKVVERTQELRRSQYSRVAELNKLAELGRRSSEITHDLVNMVHGMKINLEIASRQPIIKKKEDIQDILSESRKALARMEDFLHSVRKATAKAENLGSFVSPIEEITEAIRALEFKASKHKVLVTAKVQGTQKIQTDRSAFYRVVLNLLSNAIDSFENISDERERHVEISFIKHKRTYLLSVSDNGIGIAKRNLMRVFDPFFTTKSVEKGTGIGLTITQDLVKHSLSGDIRLESTENVGTSIEVIFPTSKDDAEENS